MYDKIVEDLGRLRATTAWTWVSEAMPKSVSFVKRRGWVEKKRAWESRLDPSTVDRANFQRYLDTVSRSGFQITSLKEELAKGPDRLRRVYEPVQDVWDDVPLPAPYTKVPYEQWEARDFKNPLFMRDGFFIASRGDRYAGLSSVMRIDKEPQSLFQTLTGVRREYRGRGVAMALKLRIVDFARENGYNKIITMNDSENAPMLAINTKLGFKRQVGWITMEKTFS